MSQISKDFEITSSGVKRKFKSNLEKAKLLKKAIDQVRKVKELLKKDNEKE